MKKILLAAMFAGLALSAHSQNILKNSNFDSPMDTQTYGNHPEIEGWFIFDGTKGATTMACTTLENDPHGNVLEIKTTSDNAWYRSYLGQRIVNPEKGAYVLSFDAKVDEGSANVRCFIRDASDRNWFALRNNFDVKKNSTNSPASCNIAVKSGWKTYKFEFDLSKVVNYFNSVKAAEDNGFTIEVNPISDETLNDLLVAIQLTDKDAKVLIVNVTLVKK